MANLGTYCNGDPFIVNPVGGSGVKFTAITPDSTAWDGKQVHGAMIDPGANVVHNMDFVHGWDDRLNRGYDKVGYRTKYDPALNIDPAHTTQPLVFAAGAEASVVKFVSNPNPVNAYWRDWLLYGGVMTVCETAPPAGAFRPGLAAPTKISHWIEDDMDLSGLRNLAIPVSVLPQTLLSQQRWIIQSWCAGNDNGRYVAPTMNHIDYSGNLAQEMANALLALSLDIDPDIKRNIAVALTQRGIDIYERIKAGGNFSNDNGNHSARKQPLAIAAHFLNDADMKDYLGLPSDQCYFNEDTQYDPVTPEEIGLYGYPAEAEGAPEWKIVRTGTTHGYRSSAPEGKYRDDNLRWQVGAALGMQLIGARGTWNKDVFFDYVDRIMERRFFPSSGPDKWGRIGGQGGSTSTFFTAMWDAYRTAPGMPPVWDWPAP